MYYILETAMSYAPYNMRHIT